MEVKNIRLGIMGCGNIAHALATAALQTPLITLYAVASRSLNKAMKFDEAYLVPHVYGSYSEMLENDDIDLIYIATPHGFHHEHIKMCLEHGKHVLCEKPLTLNQAQAKEVFKIAQSKELFLMEAMWTKFLPSTKTIKNLIVSKKLGEILEVEISFGFKTPYNEASRLWAPNLGGGALLDIGIYPLTMSYYLFGKPKHVESSVRFAQNGVDEASKITLYYATHRVYIHISFINDLSPNALIIKGTKDTLVSDRFWMSEQVKLIRSHETIHQPFKVNGYEYELKESAKMILNGHLEHPLMSHQDSLEVLSLMDDLRASWGLKYPIES